MAAKFTTAERVAIVKMYYGCKNMEEVRRRWRANFNSSVPAAATIRELLQKFEETGSVLDVPPPGRPKTACIDELGEQIASSLDRSPQKSTRRLSAELGVSHQTVWRSLQQLHYRPRLIHGLLEDDPYQRMQFCERFLKMAKDDKTLLFPGNLVR